MRRWLTVHDTFPELNRNKILKASYGMILHLQSYGRATIWKDALDDSVLCSNKGVDAKMESVYKMSPLCTGNAMHAGYVVLLNICWSSSKTNANYKVRFGAALTKLN